ncbi:hypothetical protein EP331_03815 [bacterium]|nr:MAG: hypothetical protein EP331_03815 [bacterium]
MLDNQENSIITLTSDLGTKDHYVASIKATLLSINRTCIPIDISHDIPAQDIMACAWVLKNSAFNFPSGTIHLAMVDPTTGTNRKPLAVRIKDQLFVGPDNGLFSLIGDQFTYEAFELTNTSYWSSQRSNIFQSRDIFAPVAAHISKGVPLEDLGNPISEIVTYRWATPTNDKESINGWVVHIDHFGNLVTNISRDLYNQSLSGRSCKIYVGNTIIHGLSSSFSAVPEGESTAIVGSTGMIEVAINKGNAQVMLGVEKGAPVTILFK